MLVHEALVRAGNPNPRIKVAALNPHGGEGGLLGREEEEIIAPAVRRLQERGIAVSGPIPADTLFLQRSNADAIVSMYHDQGQIAMKLLGFDRGVTVQGGLPYPVTTPAHGTAHDIAGSGKAKPDGMIAAFDVLLRLAA
jgi:4-hydroxythreonine-4-phosphate dehydrogenase